MSRMYRGTATGAYLFAVLAVPVFILAICIVLLVRFS